MGRGERRGKRGGGGGPRAEGLVVYGVHPVEEYLELKPGSVERLWVGEGAGEERLFRVRQLARDAGVEVLRADEAKLKELSGGGNHQQVVLEGGEFGYVELEEMLEGMGEDGCVLLLDQVQDVGNLGAILRSAAGFGVTGVVIMHDRAASVTGAVVRASAGQALRVRVAREGNMVRVVERLKEAGVWVYGTVVEGDGEGVQALWEVDWRGKVGLVLGGEHQGVRRLVLERCDGRVCVPMAVGVESLSVSSAAAVCLYEVWRERGVRVAQGR